MKWIKAHLSVVIAAAIAVAGLAGLALGMMKTEAKDDMAQDVSVLSQVSRVQPVNEQKIKAAVENLKTNQAKYAELSRSFLNNSHQPIMEGIFPEIQDQSSVFLFKSAVRRKQQDLLARLVYGPDAEGVEEVEGDAPSSEDVDKIERRIERRLEQERMARTLGTGTGGTGTPTTPGRGGFSGTATGERREKMTVEERLKLDAEFIASIERARSIWCYADQKSLDLGVDLSKPEVDTMWYAQTALWIQEDVINALTGVNKEKADDVIKAGEDVWVGVLPVKHLRSFVVGDYVPGAGAGAGMRGGGGSATTGGDPLVPPSSADAVFTNQASDGEVDVIQFGLELVVDAAELPRIIDAISSAGFYTALLVNYKQTEPNPEMVGYLYGSDPTLTVQIQFEGCFMRANYDYMPEIVKEQISTGQAGLGSAGAQKSSSGGTGSGLWGNRSRGGGAPSRHGGTRTGGTRKFGGGS